ncbi:uncharacterized protein LOC134877292 [Eleginops maclovinus]|uniref:uncharacterized protein LOC134877292 n=1 Tax=Eleginops maclovinus TaxID=56733 RepID=UPI0030804CDE
MPTYISELDVSLDAAEEQRLKSKGFNKINVSLNEGAGGNIIFLWYKHGPVSITRVQVTFNFEMSVGLKKAGYTKIPKDLNTGTTGDPIYLWYLQGTTAYDTPIMEINVTKQAPCEAQKFSQDWERLACDLNRGIGGNWIYAFVKREKQTYICDVTATDSYESDMQLFNDGYIRVDEDTNKGSGGAPVFIWYRQTDSPDDAINYLQISINDSQYTSLLQQNFVQVSVNLNESAEGTRCTCGTRKRDPPILLRP